MGVDLISFEKKSGSTVCDMIGKTVVFVLWAVCGAMCTVFRFLIGDTIVIKHQLVWHTLFYCQNCIYSENGTLLIMILIDVDLITLLFTTVRRNNSAMQCKHNVSDVCF